MERKAGDEMGWDGMGCRSDGMGKAVRDCHEGGERGS